MAPNQPVSRPHGSGSASRPASPFPIGWSPSLTGPDRPVARPHCSGSSGCPDSPAPHAARRCQAPAANSSFPAFASPQEKPPGWCPFPAVKTFLRPSPASRKSPLQFILSFFPVHTLSTEFRRLSACHGGYPPPYAQLLHRSPDVTPRILAMIAHRNHSVFSRRPSVNSEFPAAPLPPALLRPARPPRPCPRFCPRPGHRKRLRQPLPAILQPVPHRPRNAPENTIARFPPSAYHGYMTFRQAPKRPGYMNPAPRLSAALASGAVAW
jgi:hypothetical protein